MHGCDDDTFPSESIHLSVYSPPFGGLYHRSPRPVQRPRLRRVLLRTTGTSSPGTVTAHPARPDHRRSLHGRATDEQPKDVLTDFPGDIIRLQAARVRTSPATTYGKSRSRVFVTGRWLRTSAHKTIVDDSSRAASPAPITCWCYQARATRVPCAPDRFWTSRRGERKCPAVLLFHQPATGTARPPTTVAAGMGRHERLCMVIRAPT